MVNLIIARIVAKTNREILGLLISVKIYVIYVDCNYFVRLNDIILI